MSEKLENVSSKLGTREDFLIDSLALDQSNIEEASKTVSEAVNWLSIKIPANVLSFGLGEFQFGQELAKLGFNVVCCDSLESLYKPKIIETFSNNSSFYYINYSDLNSGIQLADYAIHLGLSLGDKGDSSLVKDELVKISRFISPGGRLLLRLIGRDLIEQFFHPRYWIDQGNDTFLLNERMINYETGLLTENYTTIKSGVIRRYVFQTKIFYPSEIQDILKAIGFRNICFYGNLSGSTYDNSAQSLIVLADKQGININMKC